MVCCTKPIEFGKSTSLQIELLPRQCACGKHLAGMLLQRPPAARQCCAACELSLLPPPLAPRPRAAAAAGAWPVSGCAAPRPPSASAYLPQPGAGHPGSLKEAACRDWIRNRTAPLLLPCTSAGRPPPGAGHPGSLRKLPAGLPCAPHAFIERGQDPNKPFHAAALPSGPSQPTLERCLLKCTPGSRSHINGHVQETPFPITFCTRSGQAGASCLRHDRGAPCGRALAALWLDDLGGGGPLLWRQARTTDASSRPQGLCKPWGAHRWACARAPLPMRARRGGCRPRPGVRRAPAAVGPCLHVQERRRTSLQARHAVISAQASAGHLAWTPTLNTCLSCSKRPCMSSSLRAGALACRSASSWHARGLK